MATLATPLPLVRTLREWSGRIARWLEDRAEAEREQFALWLPVFLGLGAAAWFLLPSQAEWVPLLMLAGGLGLALWPLTGSRWARALAWAALALAVGLALAWARAGWVAHPVLERPMVARIVARVESIEHRPADQTVRAVVRLRPSEGAPPVDRARITFQEAKAADVRPGAVLGLRVRLMPPPGAALPGAYDFARTAWFTRLGATGTPLRAVTVLGSGRREGSARATLSRHVQGRVPGPGGPIAATLATGDRGAIAEADAEAMRRSGLAHLLSISGLHVTAVVGATVLLVGALLAAWPWLALRISVPLWAAGAGALTGIGYTLITGAQVPTVRACVAALIVLGGLMLGREAITLRLVATGAMFVLVLWPESVVGPSFQLSFAAVTVIIALHRAGWMQGLVGRRPDDRGWMRLLRGLASLALTGLAVEAALMPIALAHFHRSGLFGAAANLLAIPLTTFVIMPFEALGLALDTVGLGAPAWSVVWWALGLLLRVAHGVAATPGSQLIVGTVPGGALALMLGGGLWLCLWSTGWRAWGFVPVLAGGLWIVSAPAPDVMITNDGRQIGLRQPDGRLALLRGQGGTFVADQIGEAAGIDGEPVALEDSSVANCGPDACWVRAGPEDRSVLMLVTRSRDLIEPRAFRLACARADLVVSDRRLPAWCRPRRALLDRRRLEEAGGVLLTFDPLTIRTGHCPTDDHPWRVGSQQPFRQKQSRSGLRPGRPARWSTQGQ